MSCEARRPLTLVAISDTHGLHGELEIPAGDVLVHAGDFTMHGAMGEVAAFNDFLAAQPHAHKLVIAGNHDFCCEGNAAEIRAAFTAASSLQDESVEIEGWRFYGSPWQPWFMDMAFNLREDSARAAAWASIPAATDVLVTHTPPGGTGDLTSLGEYVGCTELPAALRRVRPRVHLFGHIHEAYGVREMDGTVYANACSCNLSYEAVQPPLVIDLGE